MQGSYKNNGLPRPYYMKPVKGKGKKGSPYESMQSNYFSTPKKKIIGYLFMLCFFSLSFYWLGQSMRAAPDAEYDIDIGQASTKVGINNILGVVENDKDSSNLGLAGNLAVGSKGDVGIGVNEAPKGGMANEAPVVGNDEDEVIEGKKKQKPVDDHLVDEDSILKDE
ncbi:hypothetical protein PSN45_005222 [Yamadazyma tenuis]|uniref:Uncharacterized protein n=1 Tax=Candida tenuis (strain ATCC 10573 / BCRC 21748 / CBS 615 / JCM 9827 / NBRC 10315 / NRRL Y-1498 / VKM Y-70) TaxID=590646 RepID=G3B133_CANTC|nr:uncharacterized protein CANTEDRAFT_97686 [Yamadazyma tenuis ATCC 10573]EGV64868.1 hypothetical protein CANTEDRAFT_97686 [Yamadazyma tenuis ATCC 10573]WEJ97664.1 hypothetical protein PSN45_005222 [Yamadazyma tenuis]